MRILVFGTGAMYQRNKTRLQNVTIVAFLDNDTNKQGTILDNILIMEPSSVRKLSFDYIYILAKQEVEIRHQLIDLSVPKEKILGRYDLALIAPSIPSCYYCECSLQKRQRKNRVLLVMNALGFTGAPMALLIMGEVLSQHNFSVTIATEYDHEDLRRIILALGMEFIIDSNISIGRLSDLSWMNEYNLIVVNTACLYYLLKRRNFSIPILWWIHEAKEFYNGIMLEDLREVAGQEKVKIYAVSKIARDYFLQHSKAGSVQILPYGIRDFYSGRENNERICIFALIGVISERKGQDIFLDAITKMKRKNYNKVEFWIIGNDTSDFAKRINDSAKELDCVKMWGEVSHNELESLYKQITALVIPSRDDILPIVAVEGMMNHIGCIISENNDIAPYIKEHDAGFVCSIENITEWVDKMEWVLQHKDKWKQKGENGRRIYEERFSINIFEQTILQITEQMMKEDQ